MRNFADGAAQLIAIKAEAGVKFIGNTLIEIDRMTPKQDAEVAAIFVPTAQ